MMSGTGNMLGAGGGPARHIPVMLNEVLEMLAPLKEAMIIDGTFGAGGYSRAMLEAGATVIGVDRDPDAVHAGRDLEAMSAGRLRLVHDRFSRLDKVTDQQVDGVVLDIGVSSMQLDQAVRGFSFRQNGPLDMRMSRSGPDAAWVLNNYKVGDLARIIGFYGEERHAGRIARLIVEQRAKKRFETTAELAALIEKAVPRKAADNIHPATRTFQALRIYVNEEMAELANALFAAERVLKPGGRLVVVTFHSLEDRMVKRFIANRSEMSRGSRHLPQMQEIEPSFEKIGGVRGASASEIETNPRSRSAKLRCARRTAAAAHHPDVAIFSTPKLPPFPSERQE